MGRILLSPPPPSQLHGGRLRWRRPRRLPRVVPLFLDLKRRFFLGHGRALAGRRLSCDMPVLTAPAAPRPPGLLSPLLLASGGPPPGSPSPGRHRCACPYSGTETIC